MLMYMCLFKGISIFKKDMKLEREKEDEKFTVQSWSVDMTWEVTYASFIRFDRYFASEMSALLVQDNPQIPKPLLEFIRLKEHAIGLKVSHNCWNKYI